MNFTSPTVRIAASLLALTCTIACSKKEDSATPAAASPGWKVNGTDVTATFRANTASSSIIAVIGEVGTGTTASRVTMILPRRAGTFAVGSADASASYTVGSNSYAARSGDGSIVVSSYSANNIAGTFNFKVHGVSAADTTTKALTNGAFNVSF